MCLDLTTRLAADLDGTFPALVAGHQDLVYRVARRVVGDHGTAEEVAQDAFLRAYRAMSSYPPDRIGELRLRPWLARIAVNLARNRVRRQTAALDAPLETATDLHADDQERPENVTERQQERQMWARLLAGLPERYRLVVHLRHVEGLSYPELAETLDRPVGTIKAQVHRGVALLRTAYEQEQLVPQLELDRQPVAIGGPR